jgi:hypothetical protein
MLDYFTAKKSKSKTHGEKLRKNSEPVFSPDDEAFLHRITSESEGTPPPLPERPHDLHIAGYATENNSQLVPASEASMVPLPDVPDTPSEPLASPTSGLASPTEKKKKRWSFLNLDGKLRHRKATADALDSAVADSKASGSEPVTAAASEPKKENDEIEQVLEQLNLAAVNNTAFSVSDESRELLKKYGFPNSPIALTNRFKIYACV